MICIGNRKVGTRMGKVGTIKSKPKVSRDTHFFLSFFSIIASIRALFHIFMHIFVTNPGKSREKWGIFNLTQINLKNKPIQVGKQIFDNCF